MTTLQINTAAYDVYSTEKDSVVYRHFGAQPFEPAKTLTFKRSAPKRVKDFPGMAKTEVKFSVSTPGGLIGMCTVSTSIRADATAEQKEEILTAFASVAQSPALPPLIHDQRLPL